MRRLPALLCATALSIAAVGTVGAAASEGATPAVSTGGAVTPKVNGMVTEKGGGTPYVRRRRGSGRPAKRQRARRRPAGPVLAAFALRRTRLFLFGPPARLTFRIRSRSPLAGVRITITRRGARRPAAAIPVASVRSGRQRTLYITGQEAGPLPEGAYRLRISARDVRGRRLRRAAGASSTSELAMRHHRFPLGGDFSWGGPDARFGAGRKGHTHQGQDLPAAEGTPVLAPRGGLVEAVQYQAAGAGHYVVLDGAGEERDYVFMHLRTGSVAVREGQIVRTGQRIGQVGNTGRSFGAHLHFEIWDGAGWYSGGRPLDPLPLLQDWVRPIRSRA